MKKYVLPAVLCAGTLLIISSAEGQVLKQLGNKVKQKAAQRADQKADQAIDKGLDEVEGKNKKNNDSESQDQQEGTNENMQNGAKTNVKNPPLKAYSRYDFVAGDKIVYAEDFAQDVVGEFPLKWNTNGSGEIVTIEGQPGKWLKLIEGTSYQTPFKKELPENFTLEFDFIAEYRDDQAVPHLRLMLSADKPQSQYLPGRIMLTLAPNGGTSVEETRDGSYFESLNAKGASHTEGKKQLYSAFYQSNHKNNPVHVAIWVQKERVRVWVNELKLYDLPKALSPEVKLNQVGLELTPYGGSSEFYSYFISNLKMAVAPPDTRNKLITEGKWSTTGILFDVNSDKIKPSSYGTLKEIATVLNENGEVKVRIIGHTDSDGDDKANLELSRKRAEAVRKALAQEFKIDEDRLETGGMGESQPVSDNKTPEGKAQNRRVEFIKL